MTSTPPQSEVEDVQDLLGQVVPFHLSPGIIVLSYVISLCGAISTLELMNRRTSRKGLYNHLLLFGAAISMGGVSIWCMHYIGNRAIILHNGQVSLQIAYNAGLTAASFFVPIIVLKSAFFFITGNARPVTWWRILLAGALSGGATCGMHYLGSAAIRNYKCSFHTGYVVGATAIAVFASTAALALFFVFKAQWTNSWWKRLGCAVVLSGSVSGMHWCAAVGTEYRLQNLENARRMVAHNVTIIVVPFLAISSCLVMAGVAIHSSRIRKVYASKAQKITLAAAIFDDHGRILVTPDGNLPSEEITTTFLQKTQHDIFSTGHPLFHWLYQASRDWYLMSKMVDKMDLHLASLPHSPTSHSRKARMGIEFMDEQGKIIDDYDVIFREMFCLATVDLSAKLDMPLDEAGILWDEILTTGGISRTSWSGGQSPGERSSKRNSEASIHGGSSGSGLDKKGSTSTTSTTTTTTSTSASAAEMAAQKKMNIEDLAEKGMIHTGDQGHGSLMFLVKKVQGSHAADKLEASGHIFADLHQVCKIMNSSMQIRTGKLEEKLRSMERNTQDAMLDPGVHVGLFAIRARVDVQQFHVMVRKEARGLLPSVKLPIQRLDSADLDFLRRHDGLSISYFLKRFRHSEEMAQQDAKMARILYDAIKDLRSLVDDTLFDEATLVAKASQVPCKLPYNDSRAITCSMLAFCIMIPIHKTVNCPDFDFTPLPFFKVRQLAYKNSPYHAAFARSVHREIYPILNSLPTIPTTAVAKRRVLPAWLSSWHPSSFSLITPWRRNKRQSHDLHPWRHQRKDMGSSSKEHIRQVSSHRSISTHSLDVYSTINSDDNNKGATQTMPSPRLGSLPPLSTGSAAAQQQQGQQGPQRTPTPTRTGELMTWPMHLHTYSPCEKPRQLSYGGIMISQEVSVSVDDSAPAVTISSGSGSGSGSPPPSRHGSHRHGSHRHGHGTSGNSRSAGGTTFDLLHGGKKRHRFLSSYLGDQKKQNQNQNKHASRSTKSRSRALTTGAGLTPLSKWATSSTTGSPVSPLSHDNINPNRRSSCPLDSIVPLSPLSPQSPVVDDDDDHQASEQCLINHCRKHHYPHNHNHNNHNHNHPVRHGLGQGLGQLGHLSRHGPPPQSTSSSTHARRMSPFTGFPLHVHSESASPHQSHQTQQHKRRPERPQTSMSPGLVLPSPLGTGPPPPCLGTGTSTGTSSTSSGTGTVLSTSFPQALQNQNPLPLPLDARAGYMYTGYSNGVGASVLGLGASKVEVKKEGDVVMTFVDDLFSVCVHNSGNGSGGGGGGFGC
ncbi:hypothetical protein QBC45DRAFT_331096 [Copromyces sp. CBS 386.78]|nr:hypothetical protein QBC45DRAFT_331096 [Copromyces sp. CBS 386.78]